MNEIEPQIQPENGVTIQIKVFKKKQNKPRLKFRIEKTKPSMKNPKT